MTLSRDEAELVYKLCVENDGIFTEEVFGRNISQFRNSIQHGLVSNSLDFLNFLKLLQGSRQYSFHQDANGKSKQCTSNSSEVSPIPFDILKKR